MSAPVIPTTTMTRIMSTICNELAEESIALSDDEVETLKEKMSDTFADMGLATE